MEYRTQFNLDHVLTDWKQGFLTQTNMSEDQVEELESHLLDEMDHLKTTGLNEEEAFIIATKRIGSQAFLSAEYDKVNEPKIFTSKSKSFFTGIIFSCYVLFLINEVMWKTATLSFDFLNANASVSDMDRIMGVSGYHTAGCVLFLLFFLGLIIFDNNRNGILLAKLTHPLFVLGAGSMFFISIVIYTDLIFMDQTQLASVISIFQFGTSAVILISAIIYFLNIGVYPKRPFSKIY